MELYDAIFYRQSIRKFVNKKLKEDLMNEIENVCKDIQYPNKDLDIKAHIISRGHLIHFLMGKKFNVKSPHYILITSTKGENYLENVGFVGEEIILKLTSLGLATCWLKSNLKREELVEIIDLEDMTEEEDNSEEENDINIEHPEALIAFGYPEDKMILFRNSSKIDRKSKKEISKKMGKEWDSIIEAVRLTPSIDNRQPWKIYKKDNNIQIYEEKQKRKIAKESKISMGAAIKHFEIACDKHNISIEQSDKQSKNKINKEFISNYILK